MANNILELHDVWRLYGSKQYEVVKALQSVNLAFSLGEFVAIQGVSGSGKSTLLNVMSGMEKITRGTIYINGKSTGDFKQDDWDAYRKNNLGFIFQHFNLIDTLTALENVALVMSLSGKSRIERMKRAEELLTQVGLKDRLNNTPLELSGGQKQRVAIARALANNPDIIMADEPTGALDSETAHEIMELLKEVGKDKLIVMVTHNEELARQYAERLIIMEDGLVKSDEHLHESHEAVAQVLTKKDTSMPFIESLRLSFRSMKSRWGRIAVTAVASSIGIAGVAVTSGLGYGVNAFVDHQVNSLLTANRYELAFGVRTDVDFDWGNIEYMVSWTTPSEERLDQFVSTLNNATWSYNIDSFVEQRIMRSLSYLNDENQASTISYVSARGVSDSSILVGYENNLLDGSQLPSETNPFEVVVNSTFIQLLAAADGIDAEEMVATDYIGTELTRDGTFSLDLVPSANDTIDIDFTLKIVGVSDEIALFGSPTIYYNYGAMSEYLAAIDLPALGTHLGRTVNALEPAKNQCQFVDPEYASYCQPKIDLVLADVTNLTRQLTIINQNEQIFTYDNYGNPEQINGFQVSNMANLILEGFRGVLTIAQTILLIFVFIALFVSAILIAIVLYSSAIERKLEIGILKAVGARNKDVKRIFVAEALLIGSYAGFVGIGLGFLIQTVVYAYSPSILGVRNPFPIINIPLIGWDFHSIGWYQYIPLLVPAGLVFIAIAVSYLAGMNPATKATRMRVVDALREE